MKFLVVFTTAPSLRESRKLASLLLEKKLAACVNILPAMESRYHWKGKMEKGREHLLVIKTRSSRYRELERAILENHPYDTPEVIALPVHKGSTAYLNWLSSETA